MTLDEFNSALPEEAKQEGMVLVDVLASSDPSARDHKGKLELNGGASRPQTPTLTEPTLAWLA